MDIDGSFWPNPRMGRSKYLLIPNLMLSSLGAPRDQGKAWERYWQGVRSTGPRGEVLWDADQPAERELLHAAWQRHADQALPVVDLGCGSGRQARDLAALGSRVLGLDGSASAIAHAVRGGGPAEFRVADVAEPGLGARLHAELGDSNVHIRGVLHVLDDRERRGVAENVAALVGSRGMLYLSETDHAGDPLDYLVMQGARPTRIPAVVHRLIRAGVRAPRHFGQAELAAVFPLSGWRILEQDHIEVYAVPLHPGGPVQRIPGRYAVLNRVFGP